MLLPPALASAGVGVERLLQSVRAIAPGAVPPRDTVRRECAGDVVCVASLLAAALGPRARLERVDHPTTDRIRWVTSQPSVARHDLDNRGRLTIALTRFGRKAVAEIRQLAQHTSAAQGGIKSITVDLRANRGGDFDRMLRVAALFTGHVPDAVRLIAATQTSTLPVPALQPLFEGRPLTVRVGPRTASSAEVLAALLKRHAAATVVGMRTYGKDYLLRVVPVSHDLRLLVPGARIEVPGISLAGGLVPDVRRPAATADGATAPAPGGCPAASAC